MERHLVTALDAPGGFRITDISWDIDWRAQSAGTATSGRRGILLGKLPRWVGTLRFVTWEERLAAWNAMRWAGRGPLAVYRVRMIDGVTSGAPDSVAAGFADGSSFSDGAGFAAPAAVPVVGDVVAGATEIVVDETGAPRPIAVGQILSFDDWPFAVTWREPVAGGVRLGVEMPVRRPMSDGDLLRLEGTGLFELVDPAKGAAEYGVDRVARPVLQLQEWLR